MNEDRREIARCVRFAASKGPFFESIKQHLRIKAFYGTTPNAVKAQIWIAISVYLLVAIARKQLGIDRDLYTILQILSVHPFEKVELARLLSAAGYTPENPDNRNQPHLSDFDRELI